MIFIILIIHIYSAVRYKLVQTDKSNDTILFYINFNSISIQFVFGSTFLIIYSWPNITKIGTKTSHGLPQTANSSPSPSSYK